jgi:serine protease Do/serine protease DegQ
LIGTLTCALCAWSSGAATEAEDAVLTTALKAEQELTDVIEKAAAAFVFIGGGSGVVVSPEGYILTNHHVAGDRRQWTVRVHGTNMLMVCDLVGTDPIGDLALLKCRNGKDMAYVEFGDIGKVRVGQQVLAVGDPFKLADLDGPPSFSIGSVSALHRFQGNYSDAVQTDSAVNPGNSGGPLLALDGKLIGITGQIMSRFGAKANTGIGYAIPVDQILRFYPLLKEAEGRVVYHGTLPDGMAFVSRPDETQAAVIETVDPRSAAERAGFKAGDKVVSVDGKPVYNYARLVGIVRSYPENTALDIVLDRAGKPVTLQLKLPRMQLPPGPTYLAPAGVKLEQARGSDGLRVVSVDRNSPAERAGLVVGDVITAVDGKVVSAEWYDLLAAKKAGESLDLRVRRTSSAGSSLRSLTLVLDARKP